MSEQNNNIGGKLEIEPYILIHQLRSPLSSIKLSLQMFLDGSFGKVTKEQREILQKICQKNNNLLSLTEDLSDIYKIGQKFSSLSCALVDLQGLIKDIVCLKEEEIKDKKITLKINKSKIAKIYLDRKKVFIVLENVLDNAIKYNKVGGTIEIYLKETGDFIEINFKDSGIGIPEEEQNKLFTKFFRATNAKHLDESGCGLGLFIAKNIVEFHGGKIWFESKENKGSTFFVSLPIKLEK